jgi:hypothetical protein
MINTSLGSQVQEITEYGSQLVLTYSNLSFEAKLAIVAAFIILVVHFH